MEWLESRARIDAAEKQQKDLSSPSRILIFNGSTRSEHSQPDEISKMRWLAQNGQPAQSMIEATPSLDVDLLDISTSSDKPWKLIHLGKAFKSTSQAPRRQLCSCYPNHALDETNDWMDDVYPRQSIAHGLFILCPLHWYEATARLKLMIDRLVCADGGNPDSTTRKDKNPRIAKQV